MKVVTDKDGIPAGAVCPESFKFFLESGICDGDIRFHTNINFAGMKVTAIVFYQFFGSFDHFWPFSVLSLLGNSDEWKLVKPKCMAAVNHGTTPDTNGQLSCGPLSVCDRFP